MTAILQHAEYSIMQFFFFFWIIVNIPTVCNLIFSAAVFKTNTGCNNIQHGSITTVKTEAHVRKHKTNYYWMKPYTVSILVLTF